jgi:RNA polymerase sigma-70 factor (ECF subfamily)
MPHDTRREGQMPVPFGAVSDTDLARLQAVEEERELVERAKADPQAFEELYNRYYGRIFAFAYRRVQSRELAEDITADVFMKALGGLPKFTWQGVSFSAWLYRIANNRITDQFRRGGRPGRVAVAVEDVKTLVDERPLPEDRILAALRRAEVEEALGKLSEQDQLVVTLTFFEELSSAEVAELMGISVNLVYVRLHRALKRMRKVLGQDSVIYNP